MLTRILTFLDSLDLTLLLVVVCVMLIAWYGKQAKKHEVFKTCQEVCATIGQVPAEWGDTSCNCTNAVRYEVSNARYNPSPSEAQ